VDIILPVFVKGRYADKPYMKLSRMDIAQRGGIVRTERLLDPVFAGLTSVSAGYRRCFRVDD
jgi:hypothetical protein